MTSSRETGEKQRHEVIKYEQSGKLHWVCFHVAADSNLSETFKEGERERERARRKGTFVTLMWHFRNVKWHFCTPQVTLL